MAIPLMRIPFVVANTISIHASYQAPNPTPRSQERDKYWSRDETRDWMTPVVWVVVPLLKVINIALCFCEIYMTLATVYTSLRFTPLHFILQPRGAKTLTALDIYFSAPFILSSIFMYAGAYLRRLCFRTLGRHFTFELSVKEEHQLITSGPYALVRHPSYLAAAIGMLGMVIAQLLSPGSWWVESNMWGTWQGKAFGTFWVAFSACFSGSLLARVPVEDLMLRTEFKEQWKSWRLRTPYAVIPFVW
ncbi:hypothetical protein EIP91_001370 [Steccherinum ochraceum]|uniref:Protein-S-isoprenylcysteine O-methyltransferase n=1 Tax=Steccherinum ochraceum TaxID=92696 RepID=A0A4R0RUS3_9APHY|nr:hypothetical protein EIP91_001370 [Steccherinum ochraceum]